MTPIFFDSNTCNYVAVLRKTGCRVTAQNRPSPQDQDDLTGVVMCRSRVLCADGVAHYFFGQDVTTFKSLEVALEWADEFSAKPGIGQMCGPHSIGELRHG